MAGPAITGRAIVKQAVVASTHHWLVAKVQLDIQNTQTGARDWDSPALAVLAGKPAVARRRVGFDTWAVVRLAAHRDALACVATLLAATRRV